MNAAVKRLCAVAVVALCLSACAGIPTSGPVSKVAADRGFGQSTVLYAPAGPTRGASPQDIVRGYLDAMLAYPMTTGTASAFLTPEAVKQWHSLAGVRVYSAPQVAAPVTSAPRSADQPDRRVDHVTVQVSVVNESRLNEQGRYTEMSGNAEITFRLSQVKGQWRITNPQDGLLVNRKFFTDYFRPFNVYMFDPPGRRLVPVPVYVAVGDQLATALVTSLARGPAPDPDGTMRTYVPPLKTLRPSVPLTDDGITDVEFDEEFGNLTKFAQNRLAAQIVWTLRQVPDINAVRLVGGTTTLSPNGLTAEPISSWGAYGPSIARGQAYALSRDRVVQIDEGHVAPLTGAWGKNARGADQIAVTSDGVAAVLGGGSQVRVTNRKGGSPRTISGSRFIAPRWDDDGNLWLTDWIGGKTRIRISHGTLLTALPIGRLADLDVATFALSPDTSRYVVTGKTGRTTGIYVGAVKRDAKDRVVGLTAPRRLHTSVEHPRSATWASGTRVSFLGDSESGRQVYTAIIDGSDTTGGVAGGGALLPTPDADTLVLGTAEAAPRYATDSKHRLWFLPDGGAWHEVDLRGVTGLTYGH
ncbi:MAG: hypothetical protein QOJ72_2211 [Nocardioidaceae bacterium]|nr:hypothetical protein [Nocardioidaceae bacterium]